MEEEKNGTGILLRSMNVSFIKKDFIEGFETNYEEYLLEFVNNSKFVVDKGNKDFEENKKQSNGECDITNGLYDLDFKMLLDSKTVENMYYYSDVIKVDEKTGVTMYCSSKKHGECRAYYLINIIKDISKERFENIDKSKKSILNEVEKRIKEYIGNIKKNKNILYFIPYNIFFEKATTNNNEIELIVEQLKFGFRGFMDYRKSLVDKETYFAFVSKNNMVFLKYDNDLQVYDIVPIKKSKKYTKIEDICNPWQ